MIWILQKSPIFNDKKMQSRDPEHGRQPLSWTYQSPCNVAWKPLPGFWPSEFRRSSLYHCNCMFFFRCNYPIRPIQTFQQKIMINMLRFVAQDQCFMKYAGQCETYATCRASWWGFTVTGIVATADWNAIAWSEKTMKKQQINGSTFRWRTKSLCLIDLNGKHSSISVYLCPPIPLFSSTCCKHSITNQNFVRCRFRLYLSGRWCTTRRPLLVWKSYQGATGLFLLRSGGFGPGFAHMVYARWKGMTFTNKDTV